MLTLEAETRPRTDDSRPHAVVIGSGFGGLAAAARLGARGYRVSVLERLDQPGGRASVFRQDGFTFDAGPTIITAPFLFEELWALAGRRFADDVTLGALDPFYRLRFDDGSILDSYADHARMTAEIARLAPGDVAGFERFLAYSERIYRIGFEQLAHVPFDGVADMLRVAPDLVRIGAHRSVYATVKRFVRDERLRFALSFHPLFIGGNPFRATAIYCLIAYLERRWGVHFVHGGTGKLIEGLCRLVAGQGGQVRLNAEVDEILVRDGRAAGVRLQNGDTLAADVVVSNADAAWTYGHLLRRARRRSWSDARLKRLKLSMSLVVWYFGTNRRFAEVPHHTIVLGRRYKPLIRDIFDRKVLAEDFSLYLHRPTASDPTLAPPGCDSFYVLAPVPHLGSGVDWLAAAEPYRRAIARRLAETMMPGFEDSVVTSRLLTPLDFRDRYLSVQGAAFGPEPMLTQSAWFRPHNRSEDIRNLFLVGAGTHPGAGVPGVLSSARVLDTVVPHASAFAG